MLKFELCQNDIFIFVPPDGVCHCFASWTKPNFSLIRPKHSAACFPVLPHGFKRDLLIKLNTGVDVKLRVNTPLISSNLVLKIFMVMITNQIWGCFCGFYFWTLFVCENIQFHECLRSKNENLLQNKILK